jgi:hypothetical protein
VKLVKLKVRLPLWAVVAVLAAVGGGIGAVPASAAGPVHPTMRSLTACGPAPVITNLTPGDSSADFQNGIYAGAGPINGHFSPTTLTAVRLS